MVLRKTIYGTFFENVSLSDNKMHNLFSILNHEIHWDIVRSQGLKLLPMMSCRGRNDMLRRKLFAFGISFSLGIYSGYLFINSRTVEKLLTALSSVTDKVQSHAISICV